VLKRRATAPALCTTPTSGHAGRAAAGVARRARARKAVFRRNCSGHARAAERHAEAVAAQQLLERRATAPALPTVTRTAEVEAERRQVLE